MPMSPGARKRSVRATHKIIIIIDFSNIMEFLFFRLSKAGEGLGLVWPCLAGPVID